MPPRSKATPKPKAKKPSLKRVHLTPEKIIKAIKKREGHLNLAAKDLGVSRITLFNWRRNHPEIQEAYVDCKEVVTDIAEDQLLKAIKKGNAWAICFHLKTKGRKRGYSEKIHLRHGGDTKSPPIQTQSSIKLEDLNLPAHILRTVLEAVRKAKEQGNGALPEEVSDPTDLTGREPQPR